MVYARRVHYDRRLHHTGCHVVVYPVFECTQQSTQPRSLLRLRYEYCMSDGWFTLCCCDFVVSEKRLADVDSTKAGALSI